MSKTISASEAREKFSEITDSVAYTGESFIIVKNGKQIARLVPITPEKPRVDPNLEADLKEFEDQYQDALTELANR